MRRILTVVCLVVSYWALAGAAPARQVLLVPNQYPTIQGAVDAAAPGDKIMVGPGDYAGAHITRPVELKGSGPTTRITSGSPGWRAGRHQGRDSRPAPGVAVRRRIGRPDLREPQPGSGSRLPGRRRVGRAHHRVRQHHESAGQFSCSQARTRRRSIRRTRRSSSIRTRLWRTRPWAGPTWARNGSAMVWPRSRRPCRSRRMPTRPRGSRMPSRVREIGRGPSASPPAWAIETPRSRGSSDAARPVTRTCPGWR